MSAPRSVQADVKFGGVNKVATRDDYLTPPALRRQIEDRYKLNFDPCPYPRASWDGLKIPWLGRAFVNPPYGTEVGDWLDKAVREIAAERCGCAAFLINARTGTRWFHEYVLGGAQEIWFVRGRVEFILPGKQRNHPAAFDSLIAAFYPDSPRSEPAVGSWILP